MQNITREIKIKPSAYKKRVRYNGIGFKAVLMDINPNTLYKYLTGWWPKPKDFEERYQYACKQWDELVFKADAMGIAPKTLSSYLVGTKPKPEDFDERYEAACKQCEEHFSTLGENQ